MGKVNMRMGYKSYVEELQIGKKIEENCEGESKKPKPVDVKTYMKIIGGLFKYIFKLTLEGNDVKLGDKLGNVGIRGKKQTIRVDADGGIKGLHPDWAATNKYWASNPEAKAKKELIFCLNEHSNGVIYGMYWYKRQSFITHITLYNLKLSRANKRAITKGIKEEKRDYLLIMKKEKRKKLVKDRK